MAITAWGHGLAPSVRSVMRSRAVRRQRIQRGHVRLRRLSVGEEDKHGPRRDLRGQALCVRAQFHDLRPLPGLRLRNTKRILRLRPCPQGQAGGDPERARRVGCRRPHGRGLAPAIVSILPFMKYGYPGPGQVSRTQNPAGPNSGGRIIGQDGRKTARTWTVPLSPLGITLYS